MLWLEDEQPGTIKAAEQALQAGQVIVFPTDTVYGLIAIGTNRDAFQRIYTLKGRDFDKPLALLIHRQDPSWYDLYVTAQSLGPAEAEQFMNGELTFVISPHEDTGYSGELAVIQPGPVGLRCPLHAGTQSLLQAIGRVWATSVNRSGEPPATTADEVLAWLDELRQRGIDPPELVVLSRTPGSSKPSSVIDLTGDEPKRLR